MKMLMLVVVVVFSFATQTGAELKHPIYTDTSGSAQQTYGMMLAGLGMVAYIARRRLHS